MGAAAQILTINGAGFLSSSTVTYNGAAHAATVVSSIQLTISISASDQATAGTYAVVVTNPAPGGGASNSLNFTVDNPEPAISSVSPIAGETGEGDITLTLTGSDFAADSVVYANATALATTFSNTSLLAATIPAVMLSSTGTLAITVVTPAPGGGASSAVDFDVWAGYPRSGAGGVLAGPPPSLKQIPLNGTEVSVLDWTAKDSDGDALDVLAADHLVTELGIPNTDTTNFAVAAANPFIAVAGTLDESWALSTSEIAEMTNYVQNGGTLYLWQPRVTPLLTALGIAGYTSYSGTYQRQLTFDVSQPDPILKYINQPQDESWGPYFPSAVSTLGYASGSCTPLATWSASGDYALLRCDIGSGRAYVFGWSLRVLLALPEHQWGNVTGPQGVNYILPDADVCRMLMRGSYEGYAANPQEREWAPDGHHAALILTYDDDASISYQNVPATVDFLDGLGIKATFNFTTSPYDNGWIGGMYDGPGHEDIKYAIAHGMDIGAESFGHFPDFASAPYSLTSPPSETASNYEPMFVQSTTESRCCTTGMSVTGELGVSKWLLQNDFNIQVTTMRSGYTLIPPTFLQGLRDVGYQRDQSYLLDTTRGAFPFVVWDVDTSTTPETVITYPVMEYPMSISDDAASILGLTGLTESSVGAYAQAWENVIKFNYSENAPTVLLIHPIDTTARIQALEQVLSDLQNQGYDLWVGDLTTFSRFWESQGVTDARWP